jgi:hypothetical protein
LFGLFCVKERKMLICLLFLFAIVGSWKRREKTDGCTRDRDVYRFRNAPSFKPTCVFFFSSLFSEWLERGKRRRYQQ